MKYSAKLPGSAVGFQLLIRAVRARTMPVQEPEGPQRHGNREQRRQNKVSASENAILNEGADDVRERNDRKEESCNNQIGFHCPGM